MFKVYKYAVVQSCQTVVCQLEMFSWRAVNKYTCAIMNPVRISRDSMAKMQDSHSQPLMISRDSMAKMLYSHSHPLI